MSSDTYHSIKLRTDSILVNNVNYISQNDGVQVGGVKFTEYPNYLDIPSEFNPYINNDGGEVVMSVDRLIPSSGTDIIVGGIVISGGATPGLIDQEVIKIGTIQQYTAGIGDKIYLKAWPVIQNPSGAGLFEHTLRFSGSGPSINDEYNVISNTLIDGNDGLAIFSGFGGNSSIQMDTPGSIKFSTGGAQRNWTGTFGTTQMEINGTKIECNLPINVDSIIPVGSSVNIFGTIFESSEISTNILNVNTILKNTDPQVTIEGVIFNGGLIDAPSGEFDTINTDVINNLSGGSVTIEGISCSSGTATLSNINSTNILTNSITQKSGSIVTIQGIQFQTSGIYSATAAVNMLSVTTTIINQRSSAGVTVVDTLFKEFISGGPPHDKNYTFGDMWIHDIDANQITASGVTCDEIWTPLIHGTDTGTSVVIDSHLIVDEISVTTLNFDGTLTYTDLIITGGITCDELTCNKINCPDIPEINIKPFCRAATTGALAIPYNGIPATGLVDDVTLFDGDRVLVWQQNVADQELHGIWIVNSTGDWVRSNDAGGGDDDVTDLYSAIVSVSEGTTYADKLFYQTEDYDTLTDLSDDNLWIQLTGAGAFNHNDLNNLDVGDYQHLTQTEHDDLTGFHQLINTTPPSGTTLTFNTSTTVKVDEILESTTDGGVKIESLTIEETGTDTDIVVSSGQILFKIGAVTVATMKLV